MSGSIFVYKNDCMFRVPKDDVQFTDAKDLPCICTIGTNKNATAVAMEYFEDEGEYLLDMNTNKTFSSTLFDEASLPSKIGESIAINQHGQITKVSTAKEAIGIYLGKKGNAVLFKLI